MHSGPTSGMLLWLELILFEQLIDSMHRLDVLYVGQRSLSHGKLTQPDLIALVVIIGAKKVGWLKPPQPPLLLHCIRKCIIANNTAVCQKMMFRTSSCDNEAFLLPDHSNRC